MMLTLAWRNIWRNKRRSLIVITAIVIGIVSLVLTDAIYNGVMQQMLENQIGSHIAHLAIHLHGFNDNKVIQSTLPESENVERVLREHPLVQHYSKRVLTFGIISSASNSSGISLVGIEPEQEQHTTKIKQSLVEGEYVSANERGIVIGRKLAEKLTVSVGDKLIVIASSLDGSVGSDVFRVVGVYETFSSEFDRAFVYINIHPAQRLLGVGENVHEYALIARNTDQIESMKTALRQQLGTKYEVLSYADLIPMLISMIDIAKESMIIYYLVIGIATIFGIINAMLMSVFERMREFGVLMATGMKNSRLFVMILLEAFLLSVIGTAAGIAVGLLIHLPLSHSGINLSAFAEGMTMVGASSIVYPILSIDGMLNAVFIIPFISVLATIYPATRAMRLQPVKAIHFV